MVINRLETEASRLASTMFFEKMTALAQLTVAVIGATWALVILADTQVKVQGWPTIVCFTMANLSLASSLFVYAYGYDFIVARIFHHATFDIDAPLVIGVSSSQQFLFLNGCADLGATILLGRRAP